MTAAEIQKPQVPIILASASPRRRELLAQAGFTFDVGSPLHVPEDPKNRRGSHSLRHPACARKGREPSPPTHALTPDTLVLGADTIVVVDEEILGKPRDEADAARMLRQLSGKTNQVITGVCLAKGRERQRAAEVTFVPFQHPL